jgi:predicted MFS family arabinose efflux permease
MSSKSEHLSGGLSPAKRRWALSFHATTLITFLAASAAPTPLYHLYQESWHFSPILLTFIFSVYAFSLLTTLLIVGSLSDHIGRRPVIFVAILLQAAAMLLFMLADSPAWLVAARIVQGIATGAASGAVGAALVDANKTTGPIVNSISPLLGMAAGALGAGALVQFAPDPMRLVYLVVFAALLLQAVFIWSVPETAETKPGALASLRPHVGVPPQVRPSLMTITPINIAGWSLGGFYLSLMPSVVGAATGSHSPIIGGLTVAALTVSGALAVFLRRQKSARSNLTLGVFSMVTGLLIVTAGTHSGLVALLFSGTIITGVGFGSCFLGAVSTIMPLAKPEERAGLLSAYYVQSYLAFSIPAICAGFLSRAVGLAMTADIYVLVIILLMASGYAAMSLARPQTAS